MAVALTAGAGVAGATAGAITTVDAGAAGSGTVVGVLQAGHLMVRPTYASGTLSFF
jgi:hypothetical protein